MNQCESKIADAANPVLGQYIRRLDISRAADYQKNRTSEEEDEEEDEEERVDELDGDSLLQARVWPAARAIVT